RRLSDGVRSVTIRGALRNLHSGPGTQRPFGNHSPANPTFAEQDARVMGTTGVSGGILAGGVCRGADGPPCAGLLALSQPSIRVSVRRVQRKSSDRRIPPWYGDDRWTAP